LYLGRPAIDPMPMIRMLIVSYVFAIWWRAAKLKANWHLTLQMRYDENALADRLSPITATSGTL
jgi:hypothetical protein